MLYKSFKIYIFLFSFVFLFCNYFWTCGAYLTNFIMVLLFDNIDIQTWYTEKEKLLSYQMTICCPKKRRIIRMQKKKNIKQSLLSSTKKNFWISICRSFWTGCIFCYVYMLKKSYLLCRLNTRLVYINL